MTSNKENDFWVKQYGHVINLWNSEGSRFWTRFNVFLALNGGLLVAFFHFYTLRIENSVNFDDISNLFTVVAVVGIILSGFWWYILWHGRKWQTHWREVGIFIEFNHWNYLQNKIFATTPDKVDPEKPEYEDGVRVKEKDKKITLTRMAMIVPIIVGIMWGYFLIVTRIS